MNRCYFIAPLLGLTAFAVIHHHHARAYDARTDEQRRTAALEKQETERLRDEGQARALVAATLATEQRKRDTAEKALRDDALRQAKVHAEARHTGAVERLGHVRQEHTRLREEVDRAAIELESREKALFALQLQQERVAQQLALADENRSAVERLQEELETGRRRRPETLASAPNKRA